MDHRFQNGSRTHVGLQLRRILASRGTVMHAPAAIAFTLRRMYKQQP